MVKIYWIVALYYCSAKDLSQIVSTNIKWII